MVKVIHSIGKLKSTKTVDAVPSFMLTNKQGSYTYLGESSQSRYQGMFLFESFRMMKILESIQLVDAIPVSELHNKFHSVERKRKKVTETFLMPHGLQSLVYRLNKKQAFDVLLDVRDSYDARVWGRFYHIHEEQGCTVITFTKKTDSREDGSHDQEEYAFFIVLKSDGSIVKNNAWPEHHYALDEARNSQPYSRHIYNAVRVDGSVAVVSAYRDKEKAIKECKKVFSGIAPLEKKQKQYVDKTIVKPNAKIIQKINQKEQKIAYLCAAHSLDQLTVKVGKQYHILAGLPWFFQNWTRDELISAYGLQLIGQKSAVANILGKNIEKIHDDGTMPNNNEDTVMAADSIGWLFQRLAENGLQKYKTKAVQTRLKKSIDALVTKHTLSTFAVSGEKETWMDTLPRKGVRIEIQALRLAVYRVMHQITKDHIYHYLSKKLESGVVERMWDGHYLEDGLNDKDIRPNVFIAHYIHPHLLEKMDWVACFHTMLPRLWLFWGGLATINKNNSLFHEYHTGEDARSYHNGDSWFWINNLTAIVLHRLPTTKFKRYIDGITKASTQELLWGGIVGHAAELSSAVSLQSQGCLAQAWSAAMYIELMHELHG